MPRFHPRRLAAALALACLAPAAHAVPLIGLAGPDQLVAFDSAAPGTVTRSLIVTGLGGQALRGIDLRPATGELYALGESGGLFTINIFTGAAGLVAGPGIPVGAADLDFGIGFNPVPDRIRTVTATDKNLRSHPTLGTTLVDGTLVYAAGDVNAGTNPNVTAVAYTNQVAGTVTSTTLYGLDSATDALVLQSPPNDGVLTTVGALGVDLGSGFDVGFDIDGLSGTAFASFAASGGAAALYTINLSSGAASLLGGFGATPVRDIAVGSLDVPEPASLGLLAAGLLGLGALRRRAG